MEDSRVFGFEMARVAETYLSLLSAQMKPHGLERNFRAFIYLCENSGKVTQNDLANCLHKDKVAAMRTVDYLCDLGLVERMAAENDRRCYILEVTPQAKKLLPKVKAAVKKTNKILFAAFTEKQQIEFSKGMGKLMLTLSELPESDYVIEAHKRKK